MPLDDTGTPDYSDLYVKYGEQYNVSPYLLRAVAQHESGENAHSTSAPNRNGTYDRGLMQINDGTARGIGVRNPYDPDQSVAGAARLLRQHLDTFKGDQDMALAAYNAGPDPDRWTDTQRQYVQDVKSRMPAPQPEPAAQPSATLEGIRQKYPQYKDMSDQELLQGLHQKYYSDMPFDQFSAKLGYKPGPEAAQPADVPPLSAGKQNPLAGQKAPGGHGIVPNLPLAKVDEGAVVPQQSAAEAAEHPLPNTAPAETPATSPGLGEQVAGAAGNVLGAVKQGWQEGQNAVVTEYGQKLADKYGLGGDARALNLIMQGMNAAFRGAQQSAYEIGKAIGGEQLGRDLAAAPEAFPQESMGLHGVVERPPVGGVAEPPKAAEYPGPATPELPPAPPPSPATPAAPRPSVTPEQTALAELDSVASGEPTSGALPTLEAMAKEAAPPPVETAPVAEAPVAPAPSTEPAPVAPPAEPPQHAPPAEEEPSPSPQPAASVAQPPLEKPPPRPLDAVSALIAHGGVRDMDGDLKAMGADAYSQGNRRRLVNNTRGMPLDTAREFLRDNGYLPQDADIDSVKDLIADHLSGRPTFTMEDEAEANAWRQGQQAFGERERFSDAMQQAGTVADSAGIRLNPEEAQHAAQLVIQGYHPEEAVYNAMRSSEDMYGPMFGRRLPLYSPVGRAVDALTQLRGTGAQMLSMISKTPGVKPEELRWTGLDDWLRGQGHVTKQAIQDYVRANSLDVQEVTKGGEEQDPTKFQSYQLPGGENYRELLIKLPNKSRNQAALDRQVRELSNWPDQPTVARDPAEQRRLNETLADEFQSQHWDESNVLAHVRFNDRVAPDGKRTLLVEEVQSDWHQAGRKHGYQSEAPASRFTIIDNNGHQRGDFATEQEALEFRRNPPPAMAGVIGNTNPIRSVGGIPKGVPDAPFKTSWPQLAMKRIIKYAVDNGYDRVAWTPGDVQAARYDLSRHVSGVAWSPEKGTLHVRKLGEEQYYQDPRAQNVTKENLADHVGKDVAEKMLAHGPDERGVYYAEGPDLRVGGGGMKAFYDKILPTEVQKIAGKYGAKVGKSEVGVGKPERDTLRPDDQSIRDHRAEWDKVVAELTPLHEKNVRRQLTEDGERRMYALQDELNSLNDKMVNETLARSQNTQPVHSLDITPTMKDAVQKEGLPLFGKKATGAADLPMPHPEALQAMANATQAIVGRNARVELLDAGPGGLKIRTRNGETFTADGMTTGRLIQVALSPDKTAHFLNHEAIHALRNMGVFTPAEWKILENVAQRQDWIERHNITERYGDLGLTHGQMVEEAIADQFGHWMTGEKPDTTFLTRLRDKLSQWFERIRNGLAGHGFQSAEDVFGSVQRGEVGAREPGFGARQRGPQDLSAAGQMAEGYMAGRRAPLPPARGAPLLGEEAAAERPRATPEPTIKTDERQIGLPGMEPTARQAQAARDQAGPRGNQQPANEGLFAPKAPEESGTLFGRRTKGPQLQVSAPQFEVLQDKKGIEKAVRGVRAMFAPTGIPGAKPMEYALRQYNAERTRQLDQSIHALEQVRRATDKLPVDQQIDFTDRMEKGEAQPTPELQRVADALRQQFDGWAKKIQGLGKGYLAEAVENYMPHVWGNYAEWAARQPLDKTQPEMEQAARAQGASRRPLRGSGSFLKQRSFPTQREGIEAGLVPVTTNPIDLSVIKLQEMQKFYHGTRLADDMKQTGLAKWVPFDQEHEAGLEGYVPLNDSIFRPRVVGGETFGRVEPGNWYAIEPVARVFNNYMSKGLHGQDAIYDAFRASNNALNTLQLGLSGFHATFVSMDTAISKAALGIQQITQGRPIEGAKNILFAGALIPPVIHTALRGGELRRAWLDPESASPEMRKIANALVAGGGRVTMPEFFRTNASGTFFKTLGDLKHPQSAFYDAMQMFRDTKAPDGWVAQQAQRLGLSPELMRHAVQATITPIRVAGRLIDTLNQPLMGSLVPRAKLGVFADMAQNWLEAHPNASHEELTAAMTKFQDSVDNRLGQLNYDNLFWNKTQKDIAFVTTRSVGWNLGTVREIGGAFVDTGSALKAMAKMKMPEVTTRMAYTMALPGLTMQVGAILTYLATGKGPQSRLDYFYPPTGTQNENGEPERRNIPGYMKDVIDFYLHPQQTAENKTSPMLETLAELRHNKDYYGGIIYDPERSRGPMQAYGDYLLNQALPFSLRAYNKLHGDGAPALDQALGFWGFQPAPKGITNPERGEAFQGRQNMKDWRKLQREPGRIHLFDRPSP